MDPAVILFEFPGDTLLPADIYRAVMGAPTGCFGVASMFVSVAKQLGITLCDATIEALYRFAAASYIIDQHLDETPTDHKPSCKCCDVAARYKVLHRLAWSPDPLAETLPDWVRPDLVPMWALLMSAVDDLSSRDEVIQGALDIARFVPRQAVTRNVFRYMWLLRREDMLTGYAAAACMSDAERAHPNFPLMRKYCGELVAAWALVDARADLAEDLATGQVQVKNNLFNRTVLWLSSWPTVGWLARRPKVLKAIFISGWAYKRAQDADPCTQGPPSFIRRVEPIREEVTSPLWSHC